MGMIHAQRAIPAEAINAERERPVSFVTSADAPEVGVQDAPNLTGELTFAALLFVVGRREGCA